jgi:hypothetical protein
MSVKRYVNNTLTTFHSYTEGDDYESIRASVGESWYRAEDYDSLLAQLEKVEIEKGALQVAYDDLRGKVLGQCGQCNMLERADCYRRQDTAYQRGAREMEKKITDLACYSGYSEFADELIRRRPSESTKV